MGTLLLSRRSWSVHLVRGRPGGRFHVGLGVGGSTTIAGRNQLLLLLLLHVLGLSWLPTNWFKVGINDSIA